MFLSKFQVSFPCNLVVRGGTYSVRLVHISPGVGSDSSSSSEEDYISSNAEFQILTNITINVRYPTIEFEVPHRIEAYTSSTPITFGFTRSTACEPKLPLPSTVLVLSICTPGPSGAAETKTDGKESDTNLLGVTECNRDFATVFEDPLHSLQVSAS